MNVHVFHVAKDAIGRYNAAVRGPPVIHWLFNGETFIGLIVAYLAWNVLPWGLIYRIPGMAELCSIMIKMFPLLLGLARNATKTLPYPHALMELTALYCVGVAALVVLPFGCRFHGTLNPGAKRWRAFLSGVILLLISGFMVALFAYGDADKPEARAAYVNEWKMIFVFMGEWYTVAMLTGLGFHGVIAALFFAKSTEVKGVNE